MKKAARIICAVFAGVILLAHFCVFAGVANGEAVIVVDSVSALPGQSVQINMTLTKNPGITGLRFFLSYDSDRLTLEQAEYTKIGGGGLTSVNLKNNPVVLLWNVSTYEFTETGVLATLTFKIKEGAAAGDIPLKVTYGRGDCIDFDLKNLTMDITDGSVKVMYDGTNCEHKNTSTAVTKEPSCTAPGEYAITCDLCASTVSSGALAQAEHSYGPLIVTKVPSFTDIGLKEQKCSECGDIRTEPIDVLKRPDTDTTKPAQQTTAPSPDSETSSPDTTRTPDTSTPPQTTDTSADTQENLPVPPDTAPATGDETVILLIVSIIALVLVIWLIISKIRRDPKIKK